MKLTVAGRNLEITDAIKKHLNSRLDKITTSLSEGADIHVSLHVNKYRHTADVTVKQKGFTIHADEETKDLYLTMDSVLEKIEKQLRKHKNRAQDLIIKKGFEEKNELEG